LHVLMLGILLVLLSCIGSRVQMPIFQALTPLS
jgi:hypothetical protein